ncbi:hypothetical protein AAFC00_004034 [Neodothiora populina]
MANTLIKAKSASHLPKVALLGTPPRGRMHLDSGDLNTLPDPRTPSPSPRPPPSDSQHPDLSNEVALLSTKLINAINHQTSLDDMLQQTRHELETTKRRLVEAEAKCERYLRMITTGILIKKADSDKTIKEMREELSETLKQKDTAEKGRKEMEVELETLTSALFEEANTMVAAARKESEATERKNAQLRSQLNDTELLLASQQEQLADLKNVMERMSSDQDDPDTVPRSSTAPSTPGPETAGKMSHLFDNFPLSPNAPAFNDYSPDQPLRFSHLITPVMRIDVQAYNDFAEFLKTSRAAVPAHSRDSSGVGFANGNASNSSAPLASSSPNVPGSFSSGVAASPRDTGFISNLPPLKDNKFYKRCLVEDVEPALRLDLAPGLSWLARRTVIGAITAGTLVVEPFIPQSRFYNAVYACSLCGESRRTEAHARRHRFRTSEDDSAQRYPLCEYCLGRVRATCDFMSFLRMVRDGLWRAKTNEDLTGAWEESVRLREKMFWARLGGGVVPATPARNDSPIVPQRRGQGMLLRRTSTSSDSSPTARTSKDHSTIGGAEGTRKPPSDLRIQTNSDSHVLHESVFDSDEADFSEARSAIQETHEAPTTPTAAASETYADLDGPVTPKSQTSQAGSATLPAPANDTEQDGEATSTADHTESSPPEPEHISPVSTIPGAFD